jgi:hypothetical protein
MSSPGHFRRASSTASRRRAGSTLLVRAGFVGLGAEGHGAQAHARYRAAAAPEGAIVHVTIFPQSPQGPTGCPRPRQSGKDLITTTTSFWAISDRYCLYLGAIFRSTSLLGHKSTYSARVAYLTGSRGTILPLDVTAAWGVFMCIDLRCSPGSGRMLVPDRPAPAGHQQRSGVVGYGRPGPRTGRSAANGLAAAHTCPSVLLPSA